MIAYKSKFNMTFLLIFSVLVLGLGFWSFWFDILLVYKVLLIIFALIISAVLFYSFIYYTCSPKEAFTIKNGDITIFKTKSNITYHLKDIKEVSFNFNIPYLAIAFTFSIIKHNGEKIIIGTFVSKQIKVYRLMKKILTDNDIEITKSYYI